MSSIGFGGMDLIFNLMPILMVAVFALVIGTIILRLARGVKQYHRDEASPVLTVEAAVVAKRADVTVYRHNTAGMEMHGGHTTSSTAYYVTFQVESGDRIELRVDGSEYGLLVEGDQGRLTFQGSRYLGFQRS